MFIENEHHLFGMESVNTTRAQCMQVHPSPHYYYHPGRGKSHLQKCLLHAVRGVVSYCAAPIHTMVSASRLDSAENTSKRLYILFFQLNTVAFGN